MQDPPRLAEREEERDAIAWLGTECRAGGQQDANVDAGAGGVWLTALGPHRSSSTRSTESTISLISSKVTPGMMRSASLNARWSALSATRASCVDTRGKSCQKEHGVSDAH